MLNFQMNIVKCPTYPEKFSRDNVVEPTSIVIVTHPDDGVDAGTEMGARKRMGPARVAAKQASTNARTGLVGRNRRPSVGG